MFGTLVLRLQAIFMFVSCTLCGTTNGCFSISERWHHTCVDWILRLHIPLHFCLLLLLWLLGSCAGTGRFETATVNMHTTSHCQLLHMCEQQPSIVQGMSHNSNNGSNEATASSGKMLSGTDCSVPNVPVTMPAQHQQ